MALTTAQQAALKAAVLAETDATFVAARDSGDISTMRAFYNVIASPAFIVWRTSIAMAMLLRAFIAADWTEVDGLTVGKARIWDWLRDLGTIDPSSVAIRAAIEECWKGTAARVAVQGRILASCKRSATLAEKLFATGVGSDASPATMGWEGQLTNDDLRDALAS